VAAFQTVFFGCVPVMAVAFVLALRLRERPLSDEMIAVAQEAIDEVAATASKLPPIARRA
jgi:hypothetical protein